jgi:hypothetical protein
MTDQHASLLIAGGAITVLALPLTATLLVGQSRPPSDSIANAAKTSGAGDHGG